MEELKQLFEKVALSGSPTLAQQLKEMISIVEKSIARQVVFEMKCNKVSGGVMITYGCRELNALNVNFNVFSDKDFAINAFTNSGSIVDFISVDGKVTENLNSISIIDSKQNKKHTVDWFNIVGQYISNIV